MEISLAEVIWQKKSLDRKILELKKVLKTEQNDDIIQELISLLELRQSKLLNIDAANKASSMKIAGTEVDVTVAIRIRDTIKSKIDIITSIIEDSSCKLNKMELQKQRDKFYNEYIAINLGIINNDLQVKLGV